MTVICAQEWNDRREREGTFFHSHWHSKSYTICTLWQYSLSESIWTLNHHSCTYGLPRPHPNTSGQLASPMYVFYPRTLW